MTPGLAGSRRSVLTGLLGQGVRPSLTPELHEREAGRHGLRYVYKVVELDDGQLGPDPLRGLLKAAVQLGFDGLNVTHPVKQAMVPLVDDVTPAVEAIGALNTILVDDGVTVGHNTDVTGFASAFREGLPDADLATVVLLGAGGAGTAVAHGLVRLGVRDLRVFDSQAARTGTLARSVAGLRAGTSVTALAEADVAEALASASGLVNATPVGMAAHPGLPVAVDLLRPSLWVADIVYRPLVTPLVDAATALGCRVLSGAGMAVHQAADTFELITGRPAHRDAMFHDFDEMVAVEIQSTGPVTAQPRPAGRERKQ
ncbi:MAG TPA: shikimate dehydrogenase [Kineosporiaceae bacterium]|nr:shikimate dehydrogenase [Kineosporiaceae bacterium]